MLTNSRSLCLSNPYIVGGLVAGLVTPIPVLEIRRPAGISDPGYNCAGFDVASLLVDGEDGNSLAPVILNRQHPARKRGLPLARCFR